MRTAVRTAGMQNKWPVYASTAKVDGKPLPDIIGTPALTKEQWAEIQTKLPKAALTLSPYVAALRSKALPMFPLK